jgi:hypothetical protein
MFCKDAEEAAQLGLLGLMTGISEEGWCAGWLSNLEFDLWQACHGGPTGYGHHIVTPRQAQLLKLLSEAAGGWWVYEMDQGAVFLPLEEWLRRLAERSNAVTVGTSGEPLA